MSMVIIPIGGMQIAQDHECKLYLFICLLAGNRLRLKSQGKGKSFPKAMIFLHSDMWRNTYFCKSVIGIWSLADSLIKARLVHSSEFMVLIPLPFFSTLPNSKMWDGGGREAAISEDSAAPTSVLVVAAQIPPTCVWVGVLGKELMSLLMTSPSLAHP
jgi:hypothetical protein